MTRTGENPVFDTKILYWVGDVTESIEVLHTSSKGLNPFRSTKIILDSRLPCLDLNRKNIRMRLQNFLVELQKKQPRVQNF